MEKMQVIALRFLDGLSTAEAATVMEKSEDAVKKLQALGLAQVRRILEQSREVETAPVSGPARYLTNRGLVAAVA